MHAVSSELHLKQNGADNDVSVREQTPIMLPDDVTVWRLFTINPHIRSDFRSLPRIKGAGVHLRNTLPPVELWKDVVLHEDSGGWSLDSVTRAVQVYAVNRYGVALMHKTRMDNPAQIFRMYPKNTAVLRLYTNAGEGAINQWPRDCEGIPNIPNTVVVVCLDTKHIRTRHVFHIPVTMREPWNTGMSKHR